MNQKSQSLISILTKSQLVVRDIDVLKKISNIEVGLTITTTDDNISRYFEKNAPNSTERLKALKLLNEHKIKTYAFIGPLLPHFVEKENELDKLFKLIKETGTNEIYVEHINLKKYILNRLKSEGKDLSPTILNKFYKSQTNEYINNLNFTIDRLVKKYEFRIRLNEAIYHNKKS